VKAAVREAIKEAIKTHPDYAVERIVGLVFEATPALVRETAKEIGHSWPKRRKGYTVRATAGETATANLEDLNFKVPKSFRKRFRDCAYKADLKHNKLLFAALDAWETLRGIPMLPDSALLFRGTRGKSAMPTDWADKVRAAITDLETKSRRVLEPDQALALIDDVVEGKFAPGDLATIHGVPQAWIGTTLGHITRVTRVVGTGRVRSLASGDWYEFKSDDQPYVVAPGFAAAWKKERGLS
jgi:hypothetical protein